MPRREPLPADNEWTCDWWDDSDEPERCGNPAVARWRYTPDYPFDPDDPDQAPWSESMCERHDPERRRQIEQDGQPNIEP